MRIVVTVLAVGYALFLLRGYIRGVRGTRTVNRARKSAGSSYGQLNSVMGNRDAPKMGITIWFMLLCCIGVVYALWLR